jgi:hypothetical protein
MSTVKANDLTNTTGGIPTVKSQQLIPTAWVNFNGTGTIAIRDSEGVSSITDVGTGAYTLNFATTMANANFAVSFTRHVTVSWTGNGVQAHSYSVNSVHVNTIEGGNGVDSPTLSVIVLGGQA